MNRSLDSFETQLLAQLRSSVAERAVAPTSRPGTPSRRPGRRVGLVAAALVALAAAIIAPTIGATPAWAVSTEPDGTIHVQANRLEDAAGLQHALAAQGVKADITYLGYDMMCAPGRYAEADLDSRSGTATSMTVANGSSPAIEMVLDRRGTTHGETVVLSASHRSGDGGVYVRFAIVNGPVGPCDPVLLPTSPDDFVREALPGKVIVAPTG